MHTTVHTTEHIVMMYYLRMITILHTGNSVIMCCFLLSHYGTSIASVECNHCESFTPSGPPPTHFSSYKEGTVESPAHWTWGGLFPPSWNKHRTYHNWWKEYQWYCYDEQSIISIIPSLSPNNFHSLCIFHLWKSDTPRFDTDTVIAIHWKLTVQTCKKRKD